MEAKTSFVWSDAAEIKKDTLASVYLDYKKAENIHMAGLPKPKNRKFSGEYSALRAYSYRRNGRNNKIAAI